MSHRPIAAFNSGLGLLTEDSSQGSLENYVTDLPVCFKRVARRFLGRKIDHVSTVHLS